MADVTPNSTDLVPKGIVSALIAVWLAAAAACTGPVPSAPPVLTADVAFPRTLQADRLVEVRLEGAEGDGWLVTSADLASPLFTTVAPRPSNVRVFKGYVTRVRVPLGEAICPAGTGGAAAHLSLRHDDGTTADVTVELPREVLADINADECATRAATDVAMPSLGSVESSDGVAVRTTLTVTRGEAGSAAGAVSLTAMKGSVIFDMGPREGLSLPLRIEPGRGALAVPVEITATRCDPHAFAESKKTFVFAVWIAIDGGPERYIELRPGAELKSALQAAFDACGEEADAQTPGGA